MLAFTDNDMRPSDWGVVNGKGSITIFDSVFVNTEALQVNGSGSQGFWGAVFRKSPVWLPSDNGTIDRVQLNIVTLNTGRAVMVAPVLVQGANVYAPPGVPPYFIDAPNHPSPLGLTWDIPGERFGREVGTGPGVPDFSATAPPIYFAIAARHDTQSAQFKFGAVDFKITGTLAEPEYFEADFNEDGDVDGDDLVAWRAGFSMSGDAGHMHGDADGDADVDGADFLTWQRQVGNSSTVAATAKIPEPASKLMLVPGVLLLFRRRCAVSAIPYN